MTTHARALSEARDIIESRHLGKGGVHTVAIGLETKNGVETGRTAIVAYVAEKLPKAQLVDVALAIPPIVRIHGIEIPTDVQVMPQPRDLRLHLSDWMVQYLFSPQAVTTHQRCHDCPIPGGVQIAPEGARWVGTLGFFVLVGGRPFAVTNAHVSGLNGTGRKMCQPIPGGDPFGTISKVVGIRFDGQPNYIDAALVDVRRTDGKYAPETWTVKPEQLDVGRLAATPKAAALGDSVIKSGRTTGVTRGRVTGIEATSHVGYDEGTAVFQRQVIVSGTSGTFSAGGDSGSLVMLESTRQPLGLLFAGGGGTTILNPIEFVLDWAKATLYQE